MSTLHPGGQTHQGVLPQRPALESVPADTPGAGTKRGADTAKAVTGIRHGRGEHRRGVRPPDDRHGPTAPARGPGPAGSDPGTPQLNTGLPAARHPRVFVLDKNQEPLMPCHPARARELLRKGRARVHRLHPFTIRLVDRTLAESEIEGVTVKVDPGSKCTGITVVRETAGGTVHGLHGIEIQHRGQQVHRKMQGRAARRRGRRSRNLRYRAPRFNNRTRPDGWLAPSLRHRVEGTLTWVGRLRRLVPVTGITVEVARFDFQKMENPEISGVQYQQGTLGGYEVREYLLQKWQHRCAYCDAAGVPLNIDHIVPRARGGSDRVSNLTLACVPCNQAKNASSIAEFVPDPARLARITRQAKAPLRDAAAVNSARRMLLRGLQASGLPVRTGSGGQTKFNRTRNGLPKSHVLDALCTGDTGTVQSYATRVMVAQSAGRGSYARTASDRHGFPRLHLTRKKTHHGFRTGDHARVIVPVGKKAGVHVGRVTVRASGRFDVTTPAGTVQGISCKYFTLLSSADGWTYTIREEERRHPHRGSAG